MKLADIPKPELIKTLKTQGLRLKIGGYAVCVSSPIAEVAEHLSCLYDAFEIISADGFVDFHVALQAPSGLRHYWHPQVNFSFDGHLPFKPLPYDQAAALFEWGLNWCVASHSNHYLVIHAAVVALNNQAFIFPGTPGSGKSTLCAALVESGWRLLSDEMALMSLADGRVYPLPRPISLKNRSVDVIQDFSPSAVFGKLVHDTSKGSVGHLRPPNASVEAGLKPAQPSQLIFPKYEASSCTQLLPLSKGRAMIKLAENCFNYNILGAHGFNGAADLITACGCYDFKYSHLDEAVTLFTELAQ